MLNMLRLMFSPTGQIGRRSFITAFLIALTLLVAAAVVTANIPEAAHELGGIVLAVIAMMFVVWPYIAAAMKRLRHIGLSIWFVFPVFIFPLAGLISGVFDIVAAAGQLYFFLLTAVLVLVRGSKTQEVE